MTFFSLNFESLSIGPVGVGWLFKQLLTKINIFRRLHVVKHIVYLHVLTFIHWVRLVTALLWCYTVIEKKNVRMTRENK